MYEKVIKDWDIYIRIKLGPCQINILSLHKLKRKFDMVCQDLEAKKEAFIKQDNTLQSQQKKLQQQELEIELYKNNYVQLSGSIKEKEKNFECEISKKDGQINQTLEKINELTEKLSELRQQTAQKEMFKYEQWCSGWIKYWKAYYYENYAVFDEKVAGIKQQVDTESKNVIDLLLTRNLFVFPIQTYANYFLYNYDLIYKDWEKEGMREGLAEEEIRKKYKIDDNVPLENPVFKFHCGLKCLPEEVTHKIKDRVVLDGGAFWGDSVLIFEEYQPFSIHAFEPMDTNYSQLCNMIKKNELENVYPVKLGLGEKNTAAMMYYYEMLSGASVVNYKALSWENPKENSEMISITTIDDYTQKYHLDVGLIKLDIEGSEFEAMKGAVKTISRCKPILLISVYHLPKDFFEIKPFLEGLNLGYKFMFRKLVFHDPLTEVSLIAYIP